MQHQVDATASAASNWETAAVTALLIAVARRLNHEPQAAPAFAAHDPVTGLTSRVAMEEQAAAMFAAARAAEAPMSVILVDVDGLKAINTTLGVAAGDAVLAHVAKLMAINIQPGVDLAARHAGAQMMLVLPEADFAWASRFAERLRGTLANRPLHHAGQMIETSACFGLASITPADSCFADLVGRAQKALDVAKTGGPNRVRVAAGQDLAAA